MKRSLFVIALSLASSIAQADLLELKSYIDGVATYTAVVCNEQTSVVSADVVFSSVTDQYVRAELKLEVKGDRGFCAGGRKSIQFNVEQLLKEKIAEKGIKATSVLLTSIPNRIEVMP